MKAVLTTILTCAINIVHAFAEPGAEVKIYAPGQQLITIENIESATGGSGEYQYQWEQRSPGGIWQTISGATASELTVSQGVTTHYRRKVSSVGQVAHSNNAIVYGGGSSVDINYNGDSIFVMYYSDKPMSAAYGVRFTDPASQISKIRWSRDAQMMVKMIVYFKPNHSMKNFENINATIKMCFATGNTNIYPEISLKYTQLCHPYELHSSSQASVIKYMSPNGENPRRKNIYYDQLGRLEQSIEVAEAASGGDVVSFVEYDNMGRPDAITFMPYVKQNNNGLKVGDPLIEQQHYFDSVFTGDPDAAYAYSRTIYDNSSLNLVQGKTSPGEQSNKSGGNMLQLDHRLNTADDAIKIYHMADNDKDLAYEGFYAPNTLSVKVTQTGNLPDSLTHVTLEYLNSEQQVVAKEVRLANSQRLVTYFVFDDFGRQRYVVPPIQDILLTSPGNYGYEVLNKYCFYNEYDEYGNVVKQYVPGMEPVYNIYDKRQRLVMIQNGTKRLGGKWEFVKYDDFDRPVISGTIDYGTYETHYAAVQSEEVFGELRTNSVTGYTDRCYPTGVDEKDIMNITYYDNYEWFSDNSYNYTVKYSANAIPSYNIAGQSTGSKTRVLGSDTPKWQISVIYYDYQYRPIQVISDLYPNGIEYTSNAYNFSGDITVTRVTQLIGDIPFQYTKWYTYNDNGSLQKIEQEVTGDDVNGRVTLASYRYDDRGAVIYKGIHNDTDTTAFEYRLDGRTTASVSNTFSYRLGFDRAADTGMSSRPDGYLASVAWGAGNTLDKGYNYGYDRMGQLSMAGFTEKTAAGWSDNTKYNERDITYDINGNIKSLKRYGQDGGVLHDIRYNYTLADNGNAISNVVLNDNVTAEFEYDADGNMTKDGLTGVNIKYNIIGLPEKVFAGTDTITYIYNALGHKLATLSNSSSTYYRNTIAYSANGLNVDKLLYMITDEGIIAREGEGYTYKYYKTDHVGNVRVMLAACKNPDGWSMEIEQASDFYAFGMAWELNNLHLNKFLYNGKELQDANVGSLGMLGLYDFGARYYHPILGRWFNIDPALQGVNPYAYCGNNPMMYVDPDGRLAWFVPLIVGAVLGAYTGGVIANDGQLNPFKWDYSSSKTWGYLVGGAIVGMASGYVGGVIANSSIPLSNTVSIASASLLNSFGTWMYTSGQSDISMSIGIISYNFTKGTFGYLGKGGNKWYENMSYSFGALANISDIFSLYNGDGQNISVNSAKTDKGDWWGHSSLTDEQGKSLISVGPESRMTKSSNLSETWRNSIKKAKEWETYYGEPGTWEVELTNVSTKAIRNYGKNISRWDLLLNSCVGHTSRALWNAGIPNIYLFHPHMLNVQMLIRQVGIMSSPYIYQELKIAK